MPLTLPPLPYPAEALAPHMSPDTLKLHHGKHHKAYVDKANSALAESPLAGKPLEDIIRGTAHDVEKKAIFNNAAQAWNHTFFWHSMSPEGGGGPSGDLERRLKRDFGGLDGFKKAFTEKGTGQFGSGWAWLVLDGDRLAVTSTANAENPLVNGGVPLLTCDVWEHAYYLDYQNRREAFVQVFLDHLVDWRSAEQRLAAASGGG
jgi:Fe-Mn family superoxide dismutase